MLAFCWMGVMTLITASAVTWPLWRPMRGASTASVGVLGLSRQVYADRIGEMQADLEDGELDATGFAELQTELVRTLLHEQTLPAAETKLQGSVQGQSRRWALGLLLFIAVVAPVYYAHFLYNPALTAWWHTESQLNAAVNRMMEGKSPDLPSNSYSMADIVRVLQVHLQEHPDNYAWWATVGVSYLQAMMPDVAAIALQRADSLHPGDVPIELALTHALIYASNGHLDEQSRRLLLHVLRQQPDQMEAQLLLAEASFNSADYSQAIPMYQKLLARTDAGFDASERAVFTRHLQESIARAQADARNQALAPVLSVTITVPALLRQQHPTAVVYVFAKAQGVPVPLAVVRYPLNNLPAMVQLDDSLAMMPALKLSAYPEVKVEALLSVRGQARLNTGDWVSAPVLSSTLGQQQVHLQLSQEVGASGVVAGY